MVQWFRSRSCRVFPPVCWGSNGSGESTPPTGAFALVSSGARYSCGLKSDGWGANGSGQNNVPGGMTFGTTPGSVAGGTAHTCGVQANGSLACWGANASGQTVAPGGVFARVSAGAAHSCAIKADGTVQCWGSNSSGQASPPSGTFASLTAGDNSTCGVKTSGAVTCWGVGSNPTIRLPFGSLLDRHAVLLAHRFDHLALRLVQVGGSRAGAVGVAEGAVGDSDDLVGLRFLCASGFGF
jgi:hypothetical protein